MQITFNANTPIHIFHGIEVQKSNGIQTKKNEPDRTICEKNDICADVSKHQNNHVNIEWSVWRVIFVPMIQNTKMNT